ncbi:hypothetical protein [Yersinia phage fHe-Yen9-03]|uniref:Uncharacterized protein n=1 Tax=Yersinia phage fHe-Yen9-03 TaxID=2052743 RepID=A0A2C9CZI5_9CAUD|nr:hypothetical protein [Yersinia phage fHe-Yen9-03]
MHMNKVLNTWIENVKTYPPSEIFFEKYGKDAKAEERLKVICEEMYRFVFPEGKPNLLSNLGSSYRDFEVAYIMGFDGMKPEYITKVKDQFLIDVKETIKAMDDMCKKDQILQQYYTQWKLKFSDINSIVYDMTKDYV